MPGDDLGVIATFRALAAHRAGAALLGVGVVLPVALAVGGAVGDQLPVGTEIDIQLGVILELAFVEVALAVGGPAIARHRVDIALFEPFCHRRGGISGIDAHPRMRKPKRSRCRSRRRRYGTESCTVAGVA